MLVIEAVPNHAQTRVARTSGKPGSFSRIAVFNRGEHLVDALRIASEPAATPPKNSLDHDRKRDDRHNQNRPHNRPTFVKLVDQPVAAKKPGFGFWRRSWRESRSDRRSGTLGAGSCRAGHCA